MSKIKISKSFIHNFLIPVANVVDKATLTIKDGRISTVAASKSTGIILSISQDIDTDIDEMDIGIGNIKKFKIYLDTVTDLDNSDELIVNNNTIKYKSDKYRFTFHLLDSSITGKAKISKDLITNWSVDNSFVVSHESIREIIRIKAANKEADKVYFKFVEDGVYADVTDYAITNMDTTGYKIADSFVGNPNATGCPVSFDIIKCLSYHKNTPFKFKYTNRGGFLIQSIIDDTLISYVISEIKN
jgi:hypothetical protein